MLTTILLIILLLVIFYQDLRYRAVMWIFFPVLAGLCFWHNQEQVTWSALLLNTSFIVFLLVSLTVYISIRNKQLTAIWNGFFSWGDILFILAITPLFETIHYIYFFTFGTMITLLFHLLAIKFSSKKTVPYAGYLSLVTILYIVFTPQVNHFFLLMSNGSR